MLLRAEEAQHLPSAGTIMSAASHRALSPRSTGCSLVDLQQSLYQQDGETGGRTPTPRKETQFAEGVLTPCLPSAHTDQKVQMSSTALTPYASQMSPEQMTSA